MVDIVMRAKNKGFHDGKDNQIQELTMQIKLLQFHVQELEKQLVGGVRCPTS